jgi:AcrR family transcriptional regulator
MNDLVIPEPARRGRPRSEQAEHAILQATARLLSERGLAALTIENVALRAGVGKATIYRRWATKGLLAFDAFEADFLGRQPLPDTGTLRGDLLAALRGWIKTVKNTVTGRTLVGLIAEVQRDPALADAWSPASLATQARC